MHFSLTTGSALAAALAARKANQHAMLDELAAFVRLPNNVESPAEIQANAAHLVNMLQRRDLATELWPTPSGRPLVYAERYVPGAAGTLLIYSHYDGVPPGEGWHSPAYEPVLRHGGADQPVLPWPRRDTPILRDWRLYGRSAADSKNAIVAVLAALDALAASGQVPGVNLKFLFDGEEERESPGLEAALLAHRDRLAADLMISASGELHQSGHPTVAFGVRGVALLRLTLHTACTDMHSGHFGGFTPNAGIRLAHLVAALVGSDGEIELPDYGANALPLDAESRAAMRSVPAIEREVADRFGIRAPDHSHCDLQDLINRPTLNLRGFAAGDVGDAACNIIPTRAVAEFDLRLVAGMTPVGTTEQVRQFITSQGLHVLDRAPSREELLVHGPIVQLEMLAGFPAVRTPLDHPIAAGLVARLRAVVGEQLIVEPSEGGSLAFHRFADMGMAVVTLPISNYDCNQHSHDENLLLGTLFTGADQWLAILQGDGSTHP